MIAHQDSRRNSLPRPTSLPLRRRECGRALGVVSSTGGATTWLNLSEPDRDFYLARVQWDGPDNLLVQVLSRDQKALRLDRVDVATGERTPLVEERSPTFVNLHDDLRVVPETGEFVWSSERTGFRHLELRRRDGSLIRTLTGGEWPVDSVLGLDARRREVWFSSGRESPVEAHAYQHVSLDGGPVVRVTPRRAGRIAQRKWSPREGDHYVDTFSDLRTPWVTTIRDRGGRVLAVLDDAASDPRVRELALPVPSLTEFKNRDGIHASWRVCYALGIYPRARSGPWW